MKEVKKCKAISQPTIRTANRTQIKVKEIVAQTPKPYLVQREGIEDEIDTRVGRGALNPKGADNGLDVACRHTHPGQLSACVPQQRSHQWYRGVLRLVVALCLRHRHSEVDLVEAGHRHLRRGRRGEETLV